MQRTRDKEPHEEKPAEQEKPPKSGGPAESLQLRHNIEVHLPATKDIEVYNAIFKALKENLLD